MKQIVYVIGTLFCLSQAGYASLSCGTGSLASYIALGSGGCTVGTDTFSSFKILSGATGTIDFSDALTVVPSASAASAVLGFNTVLKAPGGDILETIFSYRVQGIGLVGDAISLSNAQAGYGGSVSYVQDFCAAGTFGPNGVTGCTGTAGELATVVLGSDSVNVDQKSYAAVSFLNVTDDFTLDAGLGAVATGGNVADTFTSSNATATPEPSLYLLLGVGLTAVGYCKLRRCRIASKTTYCQDQHSHY